MAAALNPRSRALATAAAFLLAASPLPAGRAGAQARADSSGAASAPSAAPAASSASASPVSATGLLPVFGVGIDFDALPGKESAARPADAVKAMEKLWSKYLKSAGFNVVQLSLDVADLGDQGAGRLAALCRWAADNNVRLMPTLVGAKVGDPLPADYPDKVGVFAAKAVELVSRGGSPAAYAQIMVYQLERPLNHPGNHGPMDASAAAEVISNAVQKLRAAEQTALAGSSLQATPVLVPASFDYELIRYGAIAHVPLSDDAYHQAYESLRSYLSAVVSAAPVDVIGLEWFPGSVSSEGVARFPDVVSQIQKDLPGKMVLVESGYSTAGGGESDQSKYYTQAFSNLTDMRTNQGVESSFAGIIWRTAVDHPGTETAPPSSKTAEESKGWNWSDRAAEVTRMWTQPGADSKDMRWWLGHVESHFGLLSPQKSSSKSFKEKAGYTLLAQLKSSLAVAADATGAGDIAKEIAAGAEGGKGVGSALKDRLQSALFGMLDAWVAKTTTNIVSGGGSEQGGNPPPPPPPSKMADLQIVGLGEVTGTITEGQPVQIPVTLYNAGTAAAKNTTLYLREGAKNDLAFSSPTTLNAGASLTIDLTWTPGHPGNFHDVTLDAYCDNEQDPSTNTASLGDVSVASASSGGGGGGGHGIKWYGGQILHAGALGGVKGSLTTKTDPGFIPIESIRSLPPVPSMHAMSAGGLGGLGGGSTTMSAHGSGGGSLGSGSTPIMARNATRNGGGGAAGSGGSTAMDYRTGGSGLEPVSLAFSVTNPFAYNFTGVTADLSVDGAPVSSKQLGVLLRGERRTVAFGDWTPPRAGTYEVQIALTGTGAGGRTLHSTASDQLEISGAAASPGTATRSLLGTPPPAAPAITGTGSGGAPARLSMTRALTPILRGAGGGAPVPVATRSLLGAPADVARAVALFGLSANSIVLAPLPVVLGKPLGISVRLFNAERTGETGVRVEAYVDQEKLGEAKVDVPVARAVIAQGWKPWTPKPGHHTIRVVVTAGARSSTAEKPLDLTPQGGIGRGGVAALVGRGAMAHGPLAMEAADIQLTPAIPAAGASVALSARVRNTGTTDLTGVRVEIYADGVLVGNASGDIAAGKDHVFTLPRWTATAGSHKLLCHATAGISQVEATRDVTVGGTGVKSLAGSPGLGGLQGAHPDLQILSSDIRFTPMTPRPGDQLTISVTVRNGGQAAASGGSVLLILQADGNESTRRQFPVAVAAGGAMTLSWIVTTPQGKLLSVDARATVSDDSNSSNDEARATTSTGVVLMLQTPKLVMPTR